jgi:predicted nucleotidyltransferase
MIHPVEAAIPIPYEALRDFCEAHHITRMWLFGSVLRDDFTPDSDVDVLVEFDPAHIPGWNIVSIQDELSDLLGREVQFSMPEALSRHIRPIIMNAAQVVYERA